MKKMKKLPKHYSIRGLYEVTGEIPQTLKWWREMGWLKPTKRTKCYERYTLKAYEKACKESALYVPQALPETPLKQPTVSKAAKAETADFFTELEKEFGIHKQPKKGRSYAKAG